ncbi:MAG TPA: ABC transporter permease, partial [Gemmatimonadaceae bacterium]
MASFARDLGLATRSLRRTPAFAITAIITVALGIAASTAIFSMVDGVLLSHLPYANGERLVHLTHPSSHSPDEGFSVLEVRDLGERTRSLAGVAEYHSMAFELYGHGDPMRVQTGVISDDFFDLLGVEPLLGRLFRPGEDAVGAPPAVLLSYRFWMEKFGGDSSVVGSTFTMNDRVHTVVGVLPPLPGYPDDNDIWMPAGACPFRSAPAMMNSRSMRMVGAWAVLKPDVTLERAGADLASVERELRAEYPAAYPAGAKLRVAAVTVREELTARSRPLLFTLLGTAAFLLVVATSNLANLTLARHLQRRREIALRVALGAGRWRVFRQLAAESLVITALGGILGALLASSGIGILRALAALVTPRAGEVRMDTRVLLFA